MTVDPTMSYHQMLACRGCTPSCSDELAAPAPVSLRAMHCGQLLAAPHSLGRATACMCSHLLHGCYLGLQGI